MLILTSTARIIAFAWKELTRNAWIWFATVVVLVLALLSVNVLLGVNALAGSATRALEEKVDISVYFKAETPSAVVDQARAYMGSLPQAASVEIQDADKALASFKERHQDDTSILGALDQLDGNPFGASMVIRAKNTEDYPFLIEALKNPQFSFAVESQTYDDHAAAIDRVRSITDSIRWFGMALTAIFILFSALIVFNSIRVAIYTQREEIGIMRLVGASNSFVRFPLILDALTIALISLLLTAGILALVISSVEPSLRSFFDGADPGLSAYYLSNAVWLACVESAGLSFVVLVSSWAAVGKYLKK